MCLQSQYQILCNIVPKLTNDMYDNKPTWQSVLLGLRTEENSMQGAQTRYGLQYIPWTLAALVEALIGSHKGRSKQPECQNVPWWVLIYIENDGLLKPSPTDSYSDRENNLTVGNSVLHAEYTVCIHIESCAYYNTTRMIANTCGDVDVVPLQQALCMWGCTVCHWHIYNYGKVGKLHVREYKQFKLHGSQMNKM